MNTNNNTGFSLIEVMVATAILLLILTLGYNFIVTGFRASTFNYEQQTAIENARRAMEIMTREIRGANTSARGDYPLGRIGEDDFMFYGDINYDGVFERIRYFVDGSKLFKVVTQPGPLTDYQTVGATTTIANYVNNQDEPVFIYYDNDRDETSDIDRIRLVNIVLKINVTPERAPNDYYVETDVHLRNLKDNL